MTRDEDSGDAVVPEPVIDPRDPPPDDVAVEMFLDHSAAVALAERLLGRTVGDTVADRGAHGDGEDQPEPFTADVVVALEDLPAEVASRVRAATAHARYRRIVRRRPGRGGSLEYRVDALAGDRGVHMVVGLRDDGSVAETTETFLRGKVLRSSSATTGPPSRWPVTPSPTAGSSFPWRWR